MASRSRTVARRPRRIAGRLGTVVAALAVMVTVLASTVTAAPTLPGWLLLPLEASGMPAHLTDPQIVTTSPERAELSISLADYAAAQELSAAGAKTRSEAFTAASRSERREEVPEKVTPVVPIRQSAGSTEASAPGGDDEVLVPDDGEETVPATEPTTVPEPEATDGPDALPAAPPEETPKPEPTETPSPEPSSTPSPEPEPTPEATTPEPTPEATTPAPTPEPTPEATTPAPTPEPTTPEPTPEPTTPAPEPEPEPTPDPQPTPDPPAGDTATARSALFRMLNLFRQANGEAPVRYDNHLQGVAQRWANQLAQWQPADIWDGHNPRMAAQVGCREYGTGTWGGCSELIVRNTGGASMNFDSLLRWMHGWWTQSEFHEPWMNDSRYTHVGYGFAWSPTGVPYAVTVLAERY